MNIDIRLWAGVLVCLAVLSLLFAVLLTAMSYGSVSDIPVAFVMIYSSYLVLGGIFIGITKLFPQRSEEQ